MSSRRDGRSDQDGSYLGIPDFDSSIEKWPAFQLKFRTFLEGKGLLYILDRDVKDDEVEPSGETERAKKKRLKQAEDREENEAMVRSYLLNKLDSDILGLVEHCTDAREMWDLLKSQANMTTAGNMMGLVKKLFDTRYKTGDDMGKHLAFMHSTANSIQQSGKFSIEYMLVIGIMMSLPQDQDWHATLEMLKGVDQTDLSLQKLKIRLMERANELKRAPNMKKPVGGLPTAFNVENVRPKRQIKCFACGRDHFMRNCKDKAALARYKSQKSGYNDGGSSSGHGSYAVVDRIEHFTYAAQPMSDDESGKWYKDSGASSHYTFEANALSDMKPASGWVKVGDKRLVEITAVGSMVVKKPNGGTVKFKTVYLTPKMGVNLFSTAQTDILGMREDSWNGVTTFYHNEKAVFEAKRVGLRWLMDWEVIYPNQQVANVVVDDELWHRRFCHIGNSTLKVVASHVNGMTFKDGKSCVCDACNIGKAKRKVFKPTGHPRSKFPMDLLHLDLNIVNVRGRKGELVVFCMTDDRSNARFCFPMARHSGEDLLTALKGWMPWAERVTGRKVKAIRCGGERELTRGPFKAYCDENGIEMQQTVPYEHEQNGTAEVTNRVITELSRTTLLESGLGEEFWPDAVMTAMFVANRSMAPDGEATCIEEFTDVKPDVSNLRVFGSRCWVKVPVEKTGGRHKIEPRSRRGCFLRYEGGGSSYRVLLDDGNEVVATSVLWDESKVAQQVAVEPDVSAEKSEPTQEEGEDDSGIESGESDSESDGEDRPEPVLGDGAENVRHGRVTPPPPPAADEPPRLARGQRTFYEVSADNIIAGPRTRSRVRDFWLVNNDRNTVQYAFAGMSEVLKGPDADKWQSAAQKELLNFKHYGVFDLVNLPPGKRAIGSKMFPEIKKDGTYKVRGVARGFTMIEGVDYTETFAPVAKAQAIRVFLVVCNANGWIIKQGDVRAAFLNSDMKEEVYMKQFPGFEEDVAPPGKQAKVYRLKKALYGTKQAGRAWRQTIEQFLMKEGFKPLVHEKCIFVKGSWGSDLALVNVWVDDLLLAGAEDSKIVADFWQSFLTSFEVKDLGEIEHYIGMRVSRDRANKVMWLNQARALESILVQFKMEECKPRETPMMSGRVLAKGEGTTELPYRSLVGCLMYPMVWTRPDIAYAASQLGQFNSCPTDEHWSAGMDLLRYVKGSMDLSLEFRSRGSYDLVCYTDADWAGDLATGRSVYGYIWFLDGNPVSWKSKKIKTVSTSSTQSELEGFYQAAQEGLWLAGLLNELGLKDKITFTIYCDNKAVLDIIHEEKAPDRLKHQIVKVEYLRELVRDGRCVAKSVKSEFNTADIFTKSLGRILFARHRDGCGLIVPSEGECSTELVVGTRPN